MVIVVEGSVCFLTAVPLVAVAAVVPRAPRTTFRAFVLIAVMSIQANALMRWKILSVFIVVTPS